MGFLDDLVSAGLGAVGVGEVAPAGLAQPQVGGQLPGEPVPASWGFPPGSWGYPRPQGDTEVAIPGQTRTLMAWKPLPSQVGGATAAAAAPAAEATGSVSVPRSVLTQMVRESGRSDLLR